MEVDTTWQPAGQLRLEADGRLKFPDAAKRPEPGLYKFLVSDGTGYIGYVGQAERSLRRRFGQYRRSSGLEAGPDRLTTRRNAHWLRAALEAGQTVTVDVMPGLRPEVLDAMERHEIKTLCASGVEVINRAHVPR